MQSTIEFTDTSCANCGIVFALPSGFDMVLSQTGQTFYCPNGHSLSYGNGENKKMMNKLAMRDRQIDCQATTIREQEKEVSNKKGQITRLKKRTAGK